MPAEPHSTPSFSPRRKWSIGFNVVVIVVIVFSVVGMVNFLSRDFWRRFHWSSRGHAQLSPLSKKFLESLTNQVRVIIYYNKDEPLYPMVSALLNEYRLICPRISVETVDYLRDPAGAQKIKEHYKLGAPTDKNLVIFDCENRRTVVPGDALAKYVMEQDPKAKDMEMQRRPVEFYGERAFTASLLKVVNPTPLKAYVLQNHGEHPIESGDESYGYLNFNSILNQNYVQVQKLSLLDTNPMPADCNLLIIAGPREPLYEGEAKKIDDYLSLGGRLFVLFNSLAARQDLGLEKVLAKWGVEVGHNIIQDPENTALKFDVIVSQFSNHPIVNPLMDLGLYFIRPRSVAKLNLPNVAADAPRVEELATTGAKAFSDTDTLRAQQRFPLVVAVEKAAPTGVVSEQRATRIVVTGDSICLANTPIKNAGNADFAGYAINWLLDRSQLLEAVGPQPIQRYKLVMTKTQLQKAEWLLLGAMPGSVLALGTLVWLRRRR